MSRRERKFWIKAVESVGKYTPGGPAWTFYCLWYAALKDTL